ncbi:MAG: MobQ family relaxase [Eubacteriales bacterium]|nr:MobQ family relaxase [Eubacteriales bacterium]
MAIYHCSIKIISRGKGKSAVAAAAYRAGETILNEYDGITHDYTRKGDVVHTEILLPEHAPKEYVDRSTLWNAVERIEKNKNAQLAREIELALPVELSREQSISLVCGYVKRHFVEAGMCADVCVHDKDDRNPHAHIMLTLRPFEQGGEWGAKSRKEYLLDKNGERIRLISGEFKTRKVDMMDWNEQGKAEEWRAAWADAVNAALERKGLGERVDHRSFLRQGKEEIPTVHLGVAAAQMERKGIPTERGNINRKIEVSNKLLRQLRTRINKLKDWLEAEATSTAPPTLSEVIRGILDGYEQKSYFGLMSAPDTVARVLNFLQKNHITDMAGLRDKVAEMYDRRLDIGGRLNRIDGRLHMLDEHIRHMGYYLEHREIYRQYQQIRRPKKQTAFREQHYTEIALFESANRYIGQHLNGHIPPPSSWEEERAKLLTERAALNGQYHALKEEVRQAEIVKRNVEWLMRGSAPRKERNRSRGRER